MSFAPPPTINDNWLVPVFVLECFDHEATSKWHPLGDEFGDKRFIWTAVEIELGHVSYQIVAQLKRTNKIFLKELAINAVTLFQVISYFEKIVFFAINILNSGACKMLEQE